MKYWLVKSEPDAYSIDDFEREETTSWTGVRNFAARKNLQTMKVGDVVFFYHSGTDPEIVGEGRVASAPYPENKEWTTIDIKFHHRLPRAVTREELLKEKVFKNSILARQGRLSVQPVSEREAEVIKRLSRA